MRAIPYDDYNSRVPSELGYVGGVTTQWGNPAPRHGWKVIEIEEMDDDTTHISCAMRTRNYCNLPQRIEIGGAVANAITSVGKDSLLLCIRQDSAGQSDTQGGGRQGELPSPLPGA